MTGNEQKAQELRVALEADIRQSLMPSEDERIMVGVSISKAGVARVHITRYNLADGGRGSGQPTEAPTIP